MKKCIFKIVLPPKCLEHDLESSKICSNIIVEFWQSAVRICTIVPSKQKASGSPVSLDSNHSEGLVVLLSV